MVNIPIIAVVGPTASGKTSLSINLAKIYNAEIISCDSMQIYKGMSIGTAKPTPDEIGDIPHHLLGFVDNDTPYSAADYVADGVKAIEAIHSRGKNIILAGGTGLYARSLLYGIEFNDSSRDDSLRAKLEHTATETGIDSLYDELLKIDPKAAEGIHKNNQKRVIRALEYNLVTGKLFSEQCPNPMPKYPYIMLGITFRDREKLYLRINSRVDLMFAAGLVNEAENYFKNLNSGSTSIQAIGYKELKPYFNGEISIDEAKENIKRETRRYAKRQLTWFRKEQSINWIYADDLEDESEIVQCASKIINDSKLFDANP